jgi:hypothetical protein
MTQMFQINQKITGYKVVDKTEPTVQVPDLTIETMNEFLTRPDFLLGTTYKIKTPSSEHAMYITINDMVLNEGTADESKHPYEMFINSKNMEHFQWVLALTRLISAVWRKGGNAHFLIEELKNVFDPRGGYYKKGGVYMPSIVAEIGHTIEKHLHASGNLVVEVDENLEKFLEEKRKEVDSDGKFPESATLCGKCNVKAVIILDNCQTCLNCGESKCG